MDKDIGEVPTIIKEEDEIKEKYRGKNLEEKTEVNEDLIQELY